MIDAGFEILNQRGTPMFFSDTFANRPAAGIVGRIFISTDTNEIFRDTGSGWNLLGGGGGTIGGSIIAGQVAFGTASNTIGGSNALQWDNTNERLGVGVGVPTSQLHLFGNAPVINSSTNVSNQFHGLELSLGTSLDAFFKQRPDTGELRISNGRTTIWNGFITFYTDTTEKMRITPLGRLLLNSVTDNGQQLQVTGNTLLKGSGNTSATTALIVQNSDSSGILGIRNDGVFVFGNLAGGSQISPSNGTDATSLASGNGLRFRSAINGAAATGHDFLFTNYNGSRTYTSGIGGAQIVQIGYAPTSGTGTFAFSTLQATINQTGGANGITRGLYINPTLTSAADWRSIEWSNNTGWGLYGAGTANNYLNGRLGLGSTTLTAINLNVDLNISGAVQSVAIQQNGIVQSGVTSAAFGIFNGARLQSTAFTLTNYYHYWTQQSTLSGGSAITNQYGYWVDSTLIGATNNFGFYGNIAAATGRWNLYMNGTAANYLGGTLQVVGATQIQSSLSFGTDVARATIVAGSGTNRGIIIQDNADGTANVATLIVGNSTAANTGKNDLLLNNSYTGATGRTYNKFVLNGTYTETSDGGISRAILIDTTIGAINNYRAIEWTNNNGWGLYGSGTSNNYMAGALLLGSTTSTGEQLQITGTQINTDTRTYSTGSIQSVRLVKNLTIPSGSTISSTNSIFTLIGTGTTTFQGSVSIPNSTPFATGYLANVYNITAAATTITSDQAAGGIRSLSQLNLSNYFGGTNSGTLTHVSTLQLAGFYNNNSGSITPTITNAYQLLINSIDDYGHTFTYTNRWAIYQEGLNDRNYLNGKLLIGSTSDTGEKVQITGSIRVNGQLSGSAGGNSGTHLIIYCDGTQYKIALLNP